MHNGKPPKGRGAADNPANRFIPLYREPFSEYDPSEDPAPQTLFFRDASKTVLTANDSPDIPLRYHLNPYRGCEHGCSYCYARPTHEYLSFSSGLDFETRILIKEDAPERLREQLMSRKWEPQTIGISGVTDAYQPIERRTRLTRRCLEVLAEFRNPVAVITKSALVARDGDVLAGLAAHRAAAVFLSVTTLDPALARTMEPRAATPTARLRAVRELTDAGVPCGVMFAPVIPGLNDHEVADVLRAAADAGALTAGYVVLRLPYANKEIFSDWLDRHYAEKKEKILGRIRDTRSGKLNETRFGHRMTGEGEWAEMFRKLFRTARQKFNLVDRMPPLSAGSFRRPGTRQPSLFD
ncbi:PA0069 family radical SAM protein [Fimbriiglobus ruber]|uniref:Radical SAM domain protein n=1 Tax=Fimbriiglobus ruber TaxID=1908690 RepID=A0A225DAV6_9BACT|nr:PA0069 family radical SAM protein [Fimbriiglobus ruber]OWK38103.1 Radical SAM domain protein [Fimbriiglobus ruber]